MTFAEKLDYLPNIRPIDVVELLSEPKVKRMDVARAYSLLLLENWSDLGSLSAAELNHAIITKWSMAGLTWIKREAWKLSTALAKAEGQ